MKAFMDKDFLLSNETAKRLYHEYAEDLPIIDYHCHIPPKDIALNSRFGNVTQALLGGGNYGDHYIWRLLRACGFPEEEVTGDGVADLEKDRLRFHHLAEAMERAIGNPVYQWLHLELQRYFGVTKPLNRDTADEIFDACNAVLAAPDMNVRKVIADSNVDVICTTDDPADTLEWHKMIAEEGALKAKVLPAMRPDKAMNVEKEGFAEYIKVLGEAAGIEIKCINCLKNAMKKRMDFINYIYKFLYNQITIFLEENKDNYARIMEALTAEYNPIENYNMVEYSGSASKVSDTKSTPGTVTVKNNVFPFDLNSGSGKPESQTETSATQSTAGYDNASQSMRWADGDAFGSTPSGNSVAMQKHTRMGNIGVTTSQQMLEQELKLRADSIVEEFLMRAADTCLLAVWS